MNDFSYKFYIELIRTLKEALPLLDFAEIKESTDRFFLLRHDVEFSVEKAYELARIEHELLGINSSYFFQIRNYSYNPFSFKNSRLITRIYGMGHKIGLHVNTSGVDGFHSIRDVIKKDISLLQNCIELPVDRFSFHRPSFQLLNEGIKIDGLINTYDKQFFQLYEHTPPQKFNIYYFADSEHQWKYGKPLDCLNPGMNKVQLLIHPYSWSKIGMDNCVNFSHLAQMKYNWMLKSMQGECHNFPQGLIKKWKNII
jgi:hypothetical protein